MKEGEPYSVHEINSDEFLRKFKTSIAVKIILGIYYSAIYRVHSAMSRCSRFSVNSILFIIITHHKRNVNHTKYCSIAKTFFFPDSKNPISRKSSEWRKERALFQFMKSRLLV